MQDTITAQHLLLIFLHEDLVDRFIKKWRYSMDGWAQTQKDAQINMLKGFMCQVTRQIEIYISFLHAARSPPHMQSKSLP